MSSDSNVYKLVGDIKLNLPELNVNLAVDAEALVSQLTRVELPDLNSNRPVLELAQPVTPYSSVFSQLPKRVLRHCRDVVSCDVQPVVPEPTNRDKINRLFFRDFDQVPDEFKDPFTTLVINVPVFDPNHPQVIYDYASICLWLEKKQSNPYTRQALSIADLQPATAWQARFDEFVRREELAGMSPFSAKDQQRHDAFSGLVPVSLFSQQSQ